MKIAYFTLGCKVNQYETEAIREALEKKGFTSVAFESCADAYIINTCTVTAMSDKKSRQMLHRARRTNPAALIGVIGCYVQKTDQPAALADADILLGTKDKGKIVDLIAQALTDRQGKDQNIDQGCDPARSEPANDASLPAGTAVSNLTQTDTLANIPASSAPLPDATAAAVPAADAEMAQAGTDQHTGLGMSPPPSRRAGSAQGPSLPDRSLAGVSFERMHITSFESRTRAFVKVEDGCDNFCAYCIIPYVRGRVRSRALADILTEVDDLCASGYREIVLTGIHEASYGKDLGDITFLDLIKKVGANPHIRRLRLGSLEPVVADAHFVAEIANLPALCDQFHLSLQSGCDQTLARMGRRYTTAQYAACVDNLRAHFPDAAITTDVIVGFPGEDEAEFEATAAFLDQIGFAKVHLFPYSAREGTRAATLPGQLPKQVKQQRLHQLEKITKKHAAAFLRAHIGREMEVLFESGADGIWEGLTTNYLRVRVASDLPLSGQIRPVRISAAAEDFCTGDLLRS